MAVRHEAEGADAVETVRKSVEEKPTDELIDLQPHHLGCAAIAIVLPGEGDVGLAEGNEAGVGDRHAVGVTTEISKYLCWAAEWLLGVDDPIDAPHGRELRGKYRRVGERREITKEAEIASSESRGQSFEEQTPKEKRKRLDRQKKVGAACDPTCPIGCDTAARDNTVQMRVMGQSLTPAVQNGKTTDPGPEAARVRCQRRHRLCSGPEQNRIDELLILESDCCDRLGQCEDDVEIGNRQQLGLARGNPGRAGRSLTLRAMPVTTGIVGNPRHATIVTSLDVAAECGGAADGNRAHHPLLDTTEMTLMCTGVGGTMTAQDVGDLQRRLIGRVRSVRHGPALPGRHYFQGQTVERALRRPDRMGRDLSVARR